MVGLDCRRYYSNISKYQKVTRMFMGWPEKGLRKMCDAFSWKMWECGHQEYISGPHIPLWKGFCHFSMYKVGLKLSFSFNVDYASAGTNVAQGLQDIPGLFCDLKGG